MQRHLHTSPTDAEIARLGSAERDALYLAAKARQEAIMADLIDRFVTNPDAQRPAPASAIKIARARSIEVRRSRADEHARLICQALTQLEALDEQNRLQCTYDTAAELLNNHGFLNRFGQPWNRVTVRRAINRLFRQEPRRPGPVT